MKCAAAVTGVTGRLHRYSRRIQIFGYRCGCPLRVKIGKAQNEHMLSGLRLIATDVRTSSNGSSVPTTDVEARRLSLTVAAATA